MLTLISIDNVFDIKTMYNDPSQKNKSYIFKGMICFQAAHYLSFFRRVKHKLTKLDLSQDQFQFMQQD